MLTPDDLATVQDQTRRCWDRHRAELVEQIALAIECWGGVDPRKGVMRKRMAKEIRCKFGVHEEDRNDGPRRTRHRSG